MSNIMKWVPKSLVKKEPSKELQVYPKPAQMIDRVFAVDPNRPGIAGTSVKFTNTNPKSPASRNLETPHTATNSEPEVTTRLNHTFRPSKELSTAGTRHTFTPLESLAGRRIDVVPHTAHAYVAPVQSSDNQIEIPRMCASRRMPWLARYVWDGTERKWTFSQGIQADEFTQRRIYDACIHEGIQLRMSDCDYEECGWCSSYGFGATYCVGCGTFICHGTKFTRGSARMCICVCGRDLTLQQADLTQTAIIPKVRER